MARGRSGAEWRWSPGFPDPTYACPPFSLSKWQQQPSHAPCVHRDRLSAEASSAAWLNLVSISTRRWVDGASEGVRFLLKSSTHDPSRWAPLAAHQPGFSSQLAELDCRRPGPQSLTLGLCATLLAEVSCVYTSGGSAWGLFDVGDGDGQVPLCIPGNHRLPCQRAITPVGESPSQKVAHKEGLACV